MNDLTVIVVTWNSGSDIEECLRTALSASRGLQAKIVVVDNGSTDGTRQIVAEHFPEVSLVANRGNIGFAAANNVGIRQADSRYLMLLNPDTIVREGAFRGLVGFMDAHSDCWAAGPALLNGDGTPQRTGVRFPSLWNLFVESFFLDRLFPRSRIFGRHRELYEDPGRSRPVDFVQGSCLIVRREAVEAVGVLDEEFFMYFEETDWCYRMKKAGGTVYYTPDGEVVHLGGGVMGHYDESRLVHFHRSLLRFYRKHSTAAAGLILRAILFVRSIIRVALWGAIAAFRPSVRARAASSVRGYARVIALLFSRG